jgi:hypothetical protein
MAARPMSCVAAVVAALAALVLGGCAKAPMLDRTPSPEESLARIQATAAMVTEAKSARLSMSARTIFAGEDVPANTVTTQGVYDFAAHKGQMDTTMKMAGIPFKHTARTLITGSAVYMRMPEMPEMPGPPDGGPATPEGFGPGKPWIKLEMSGELAGANMLGLGSGFGFGEGGSDPTEALEFLPTASKADAVGEEEVRGVRTTRYAVTFDPSKQADQLPKELRDQFEESGLAFPKPADVWIDDQGRLRKIQYAVTLKIPAEVTAEVTASQMTTEITLELYDFGVKVDVTPPPASQVEVMDVPPDCPDEKGRPKGGSSDRAKQDTGEAEMLECLEGWSAEESGATSP